MKQSFS